MHNVSISMIWRLKKAKESSKSKKWGLEAKKSLELNTRFRSKTFSTNFDS